MLLGVVVKMKTLYNSLVEHSCFLFSYCVPGVALGGGQGTSHKVLSLVFQDTRVAFQHYLNRFVYTLVWFEILNELPQTSDLYISLICSHMSLANQSELLPIRPGYQNRCINQTTVTNHGVKGFYCKCIVGMMRDCLNSIPKEVYHFSEISEFQSHFKCCLIIRKWLIPKFQIYAKLDLILDKEWKLT